jgi:hypothetical protein
MSRIGKIASKDFRLHRSGGWNGASDRRPRARRSDEHGDHVSGFT